jgi:hypothetical protein
MAAAVLVFGLGTASAASAQDGFDINYMDFGPVVGVGGIHGGGFSLGGRFEKAIVDLPQANGVLGLSVGVDYYNYSPDVDPFDVFDDEDFGVTVVPITVMVNYHFKFPSQPKLDVFAGAGFGYERISVNCEINGIDFCDDNVFNSGALGAFHGGIRYFWRDGMAAFAEATNFTGALTVGVMFKFRGR